MADATSHDPAPPLSDQREREREEQALHEGKYRALVEHAFDAILIADDRRVFIEANAAACELIGAPRERIVGTPLERYFEPVPSPGQPDLDARWEIFLRDGVRTAECSVRCADGGARYAEVRARANFLPGLHLFVAHDTTEKKFAEEAVRCAEQLYRTLVETTNTGYVITDADGLVLEANAEYVHLTGRDRVDELRGRHPREWTAPADRLRLDAGLAACREHGSVRDLEVDFVDPDGNLIPVEINASAVQSPDGVRLLSLCRDVTGRLQTRQELLSARLELESRVRRRTAELHSANEQIRSRARQQETVAELGRRALTGADIEAFMQEAVQTVSTVLDMGYCAILEHTAPDSGELVLRAGVGWPGQAGNQIVATTDPALAPGFALRAHGPVAFEDLGTETRFRPMPGMSEAGIVSGISVSIADEHRQFGLLTACAGQRRRFTADDAHFLQSVANVLAAAIERQRAEEAILLAQQGAVQANNAKLDFLSRMSHELRTPLNAILGFSQLLEIERLNAGQRESVEQIARAGRHLLELVNEVLDISRIDSGNIALVPEPLAVQDLLGEAVDLIRPLADAREITIVHERDAPDDDGQRYVLADRQRLRQVLLNLLSNAVKYNSLAGRVTLGRGLSPDGSRVRLSVADTGRGIAPENLPLLFTPFERLGAENTNVEGSGMGLALSKRLVEAQGGELGVESTVNVGSTFWIDLPMAAAPLDAPDPLFDELIRSQLFQDGDEVAEPPVALPPLPPQPAPHPAPAALPAVEQIVLHIEDNEPNQRLIEMLLSQRPRLRLLTASRGWEGLELAHKHHPDLILLDVHLPDTSGENVLQDLRADESMRDTPIVIVSADAASIKHHQLHEIGANNYLLKPFNVTQFLKILDQYLLKRAA